MDKLVWSPLAAFLTWLAKKGYDKWLANKGDDSVPVVRLFINSDYKFSEISDPNFESKIQVARHLLRSGASDFIKLKVELSFKTSHLSKEARTLIHLKTSGITEDIKKQFEIALVKPITIQSECPKNIRRVFNFLLTRHYASYNGAIKLDVYRNHSPEISFSVWLSEEDLLGIASVRGTSLDVLKQDLDLVGCYQRVALQLSNF